MIRQGYTNVSSVLCLSVESITRKDMLQTSIEMKDLTSVPFADIHFIKNPIWIGIVQQFTLNSVHFNVNFAVSHSQGEAFSKHISSLSTNVTSDSNVHCAGSSSHTFPFLRSI
eukprot:gb/GEZJ01007403.1/.p2 GENE.gb/GEZJ01007403.1/~~gb/GEZJ01007403.1/.p2  ORF type:complete len:113 (-),score=10.07 gb/GEZJ01007403.1/:142-480(-)